MKHILYDNTVMNDPLTENRFFTRINCPVCNSDKLKVRNKVKYNELKQKGSMELESLGISGKTIITVNICSNCKFVFVNPRIKSEYQHLLYNKHKKINLEKVTIRNGILPPDMRRRRVSAAFDVLQIVPELVKRERPVVFDYGCGFGHVLTLANVMGMETYGVDLDDIRVDYCQKNGLKVTSVDEFKYKHIDVKADVIFLLSTLEHIVNLNEVFTYIEDICKPGTILILDGFTPKTIDLEKRTGKYIDAHFIEHINYFNIKTLDVLLKKYNFNPGKRYIAKQVRCLFDIFKLALSFIISNSFSGKLQNKRKFFTRVYIYKK